MELTTQDKQTITIDANTTFTSGFQFSDSVRRLPDDHSPDDGGPIVGGWIAATTRDRQEHDIATIPHSPEEDMDTLTARLLAVVTTIEQAIADGHASLDVAPLLT